MKARYCFANHIFEINSLFDYFYNFAIDYTVDKEAEFKIKVSLKEIEEWKSARNDCDGFSFEYIETLFIHEKIAKLLAKENIFILHGSTIGFGSLENAYVFVAPSGVGKSTHVSILKKVFKDKIIYINDDKPFIELNNNTTVYGSPWNGKERLSNNVKGVLKGIFVISRGKENKVSKIPVMDAFEKLVHQLYIPKGKEESAAALNALIKLSNKLPVYSLEVNMSEEAAKTSGNIMERL